MTELADRWPVVRYDQIGCGRSDRPNDPSLWRVQTFVEELTALRDALGLDRMHLLGHSWGGMLAIEYQLTRPEGVRSLVLSSSLCSTPHWVEEARRLRSAMPAHIVGTMRRFEDHHDPTAAAATAPAAVSMRPGIAPKDVAFQARLMCGSLPLMTSALVQRLASWASFVPPLRRAAYEMPAWHSCADTSVGCPTFRSISARITSRATSTSTKRCGVRASSSPPACWPIGMSNHALAKSPCPRSCSRGV